MISTGPSMWFAIATYERAIAYRQDEKPAFTAPRGTNLFAPELPSSRAPLRDPQRIRKSYLEADWRAR